jgi:hypothetical protein
MTFNVHAAQTATAQLLAAALQSSSIKLRGPGHDDVSNAFNSKLDADYLNYIFTSISNNITPNER